MEKTIGLNDFAVSWEYMPQHLIVIEENITQERAIELLQLNENYHVEVYVDGFWEMVI